MLIHDEGIRLKAYKDSKGILTIGVGRNLESKGLYVEEVKELLVNDINDSLTGAENLLGKDWFNSLSDVRKLAILNLIFNMGEKTFSEFGPTIALMKAGDWRIAADHILGSKYAQDVGERAGRIVTMLVKEEFPY